MDDRNILKYKYDFLNKGLNRISAPNEKERLYVISAKTETANLLRKIYPNRVVRAFFQFKRLIIDNPTQRAEFRNNKNNCIEKLNSELKSMGLQHFSSKLDRELDFERTSIDLSSYSNLEASNKLNVNVHLNKNKDGNYQFNGYTATIILKNGQELSAKISSESGIKIDEAVKILQGRPIFKTVNNNDGTTQKQWLQLEKGGNELDKPAKILSYPVGYDYDLKKILLDSGVKLGHYKISTDPVLRGIEAGNRVAINVNDSVMFFVKANPSENKVDFLNADMRPISIETLHKIINPPKQEKSESLEKQNFLNLEKQNQVQPDNQLQITN